MGEPSDNRIISLRKFSSGTGVVVAATGCFVLFGWSLHLPPLASIFPSFGPINPATANG